MNYRKIIFFGITFSIIVLLPIIFYIINFSGSSVSSLPTDWGAFGDYLSGTIGIVLLLANLMVFVWISLLLSRIDRDLRSRETKLQKKLAIYNIISLAFNDIATSSAKISDFILTTKDDKYSDFVIFTAKIYALLENYSYLFANIDYNEASKKLYNSTESISEYFLKLHQNQVVFNQEEISKLIADYYMRRKELLLLLQEFINNYLTED